MNFSYKKGITLIELLVAISIFIIILAVVIPRFSSIREDQTLKNGADDIVSALDKARSQTLSSLNSSEYGVHFQSDEVVIFKGQTYYSDASDNEILDIISPASISTISLTGGINDLYFNRLTGSPSVTGTIIITTGNFTKTITISSTGAVSLN